jgi:hypothetical protein
MNQEPEWTPEFDEAFEQGIQEGMKRERALWQMQAEGQKIEQPKREWVGLTDEEMLAAIRPMYRSDGIAQNAFDLSKDEYMAIEAALKERNT